MAYQGHILDVSAMMAVSSSMGVPISTNNTIATPINHLLPQDITNISSAVQPTYVTLTPTANHLLQQPTVSFQALPTNPNTHIIVATSQPQQLSPQPQPVILEPAISIQNTHNPPQHVVKTPQTIIKPPPVAVKSEPVMPPPAKGASLERRATIPTKY